VGIFRLAKWGNFQPALTRVSTRHAECVRHDMLHEFCSSPFPRNSPAQRSLARRKLGEFLAIRRAKPALCGLLCRTRFQAALDSDPQIDYDEPLVASIGMLDRRMVVLDKRGWEKEF
jgi:hypothetical protein